MDKYTSKLSKLNLDKTKEVELLCTLNLDNADTRSECFSQLLTWDCSFY